MAGFSGLAARSGVQALDELFAERIKQEFLQQQQDDLRAARERDDLRASEQLELQRQQMGEASAERRRLVAKDEAATKKAEDKEAYEKTARLGLTEIMGRLGQDPSLKNVLAEHAAASGVEPSDFTTKLLTPKEKKYHTVNARGPKGELIVQQFEEGSPELQQGVRGYTAPVQGKQEERQWMSRLNPATGKREPVYDYYKPGDDRLAAPGSKGAEGGSNTAGITEYLNQAKRLSIGTKDDPGINSYNFGPAAVASGLGQRVAGYGQLQHGDKVNMYTKLREGFIPMLARAVGHVGVLTELDVAKVRDLLPTPEMREGLARENWTRIEAILREAQAIELLPEGSDPDDENRPQINERGLGRPEVDAQGNNSITGTTPVMVAKPAGGGGGAQQQPIPGVPGGVAELVNGRWIRRK